MKKTDFIKLITEQVNNSYEKTLRGKNIPFSQNDTKAYLDAIKEVVYANCASDEVPVLDGLTVTSKIQAASVRRNPSTGEPVNVPEKRVPKVKIGKLLKDAVAY